MTKEQVSIANGGGGNFGVYRADINQIKTYSYSYFVSHCTAQLQLKPKATTNKDERRKEIAALKAKLMATPEANDAALNTPNVTATGTINRTATKSLQ